MNLSPTPDGEEASGEALGPWYELGRLYSLAGEDARRATMGSAAQPSDEQRATIAGALGLA